MLHTENGLLVDAEIAGVHLARTVGGDVLLFIPQRSADDDNFHAVLKERDVRQLAHALSCAFTPYGSEPW